LYPAKTAWLPKGAHFSALLTPDAKEYFLSLRPYFEKIWDEGNPAFARHHIQFQKIAALLAWYRIGTTRTSGAPAAPSITCAERQGAEAAVRAAETFTPRLLETSAAQDPSTPATIRFKYTQLEKVRAALEKIPAPATSQRIFLRVRRQIPRCAEVSEI